MAQLSPAQIPNPQNHEIQFIMQSQTTRTFAKKDDCEDQREMLYGKGLTDYKATCIIISAITIDSGHQATIAEIYRNTFNLSELGE